MNSRHLLFIPLVLLGASASPAESVDFESHVFPLLQKHCVECHGPKKQKSSLRVDSRKALLKGGDFGPAVIPGDPVSSHLIETLTTDDKDTRMPPKGEGLSLAEVETLKTWIAQGAIWPGQMAEITHEKVTSNHWSFQPLAGKFSANSLDAFVHAKLAENGLKSSSKADRPTLLRRVFLDLTGLPPAPQDVKMFVQDTDPKAYEKVVERLLQSPRFGEHWAQHWLDVIRYADTRGYEYNTLRNHTWPFRDWVIDALNRDLPYDQFVFQQIAGDTVGIDPATGFLVTAPLPTPAEVGQVPSAIKAARFNALDEIVQNVGASILGLTVGCARCHNHKFDPISQKDYYRVVSVFAGVEYESRPWRKDGETERFEERARIAKRIGELHNNLSKFPHWREMTEGRTIDHFEPVKAKFVRMTILATDATSEGPAFDEIAVFPAPEGDSKPSIISTPAKGVKVTSSGAAKQLNSKDEFLTDGKFGKTSTWVADRRPAAWVQVELKESTRINQFEWSRDRELFKTDPVAHARRLTSVWRIEVAEKEGQWKTVVDESRSSGLDAQAMQERRYLEEELAALTASAAKLGVMPEVFAGKFSKPPLINILGRGDPEQPRDPVGPGALEILDGFELPADAPDTERRATFARWLTTKAAPLTARVAVNRLWQNHFGTGLVETPGDFGTVGGNPVNQELLDWLAQELISSGWSLKHVHRLIVTSATYRQKSEPDPVAKQIDAASRLLWRFPSRRLDAEAIRDSMLSISGVLDLKMGGEGVNIYKPKGAFDQWKPKDNPGPEAWRRMIYLAKMRGADDGMFKTFDLPDCGQVRAKRSTSTTPLQALNLLNGKFTLEQAGLLSKRLEREASADLKEQVNQAFLLTLARYPSERELTACLTTAQTEGIETVCRALFNTNEFLFLP